MVASIKVALLVETSRGYGRGLLQGIMQYSRLHGPWQFHLTPGDFEQVVPRMKDWKGDGIIARVINQKTANLLLKTGLPLVVLDLPESAAVTFQREGVRFVEMMSDSDGATKMAVELLLAKRFRHFAFVGYHGQVWSEKREQTFINRMTEEGRDVHLYKMPVRHGASLQWEKEEPILVQCLKNLPKPIGLMVCNDQRGREVLDACSLAEIAVPEEISVIGIDNDELLCELSFPPLSSVALNAVQGGYLAAAALHKMIQNTKIRKGPFSHKKIIVPPLHIVERRSTESVAIDDHNVATALQFLHTQPPAELTIDKVVASTCVSRRILEIRFRKLLGRTILQEIQKVRIERAKRLLLETAYSVEQIAEIVGFSTSSYFVQFFRIETGRTPAKFRREVRVG
ncbi:MAG: DNA-binding transcriptional regulator [Planctomycetaceae bacterium]|nr:DNA-binding transcriptional regulator [Planctomycetaceae bacterium]